MVTELYTLLMLAGIAQIVLVLGSLTIPYLLDFKNGLSSMPILLRQMFWTYAGYILIINLCFGLVSALCYADLINGSKLATLVNAFIGLYWISRVLVQFLYFDRSAFPKGAIYTLGETMLVTLFIALSAVYSYAFCYDLNLPS